MSEQRSPRERITAVALTIGFVMVTLTAVGSVTSLEFNEELGAEMQAAREAAERGDLDVALEHLLEVTRQVPDSVGALRSAVCIAPEADRGELVPLLLSDLLLAGWDWQEVPIGCAVEELYRTLFGVYEVPGAQIVYRRPDIEDGLSTDLVQRGLDLVDGAGEEPEPGRISRLLAIAACVNTRHGLTLMGEAQMSNVLDIDETGVSALPDVDRCTEPYR